MIEATGKLIVVIGPAAVGKSTITRALQSRLGRGGDLWLALEIDVFGSALSRHWLALGEHQGRHAQLGFAYTRVADGSIKLTLGPDGRRVLVAFHRSVAAVVKSGVNVVCEAIVYDDEDWRDWSETLGGISTYWVKLDAPLAILEEREKARAEASRGLARGMVARGNAGKFDIEVDTAADAVSVIVDRIVNALPR